MGEPERLLSLAGVYHSISSLESLNAYNLNGLFAVLDQYGKKFGLGSVFRYDPAVTTDETRFKILRSQNQKSPSPIPSPSPSWKSRNWCRQHRQT